MRFIESSAAFGPDFSFDSEVTTRGPEARRITQLWLGKRLRPDVHNDLSLVSTSLLLRYHFDEDLGGRYLLTVSSRNEGTLSHLPFAVDFLEAVSLAYGSGVTSAYGPGLLALARTGASSSGAGDAANSEPGSELERRLPTELVSRLRSSVPPRRYDVALMPESVGWINVWAPDVIAAIGPRRIEAQPWYMQRATSEEGKVLVATAKPPEPPDFAALECLAQIVDGLELDALKSP